MQPREGGWRAVIGEDWSQGRATFSAAWSQRFGNEAMRRLVPADRELRGLETTFVGPALGRGRHGCRTFAGRQGRQHCPRQGLERWPDCRDTDRSVYGAARHSAFLAPAVAAEVPPAANLPDRSGADMGGPSFVRHFGYRWAEGAAPFAGSSLRTAKIYVRHQDPAALTESHVVALIDSIPSVVLQLMSTPAPSSSRTWTVQFLRHDYSFAPEAWWRIDAEVNSAGSGYSCESCVLMDPSGKPAAVARQMVAVFG